MKNSEPAKKPNPEEPRKRRRAIRSRPSTAKPTELFQQEPEEELGEGDRPHPKRPGDEV